MSFCKTLIVAGILALSVSAAVTVKTYSLPNGYHSLWHGVGRDWNGNIYVGSGDDTYNAALFRFNPTTDAFVMLGDVRTTAQSVNNWLSNDFAGKIHSAVEQGIDSNMYFASHRKEDNTAYAPGYRGGHFFRYNMALAKLEDVSAPNVGADSNGIMDVALGLQYNYVYGIDEASKFYRQNIVTKQLKFIFDTKSESRNMFDDNQGRGFVPTTYGRIGVFFPQNDSFNLLPITNAEFQRTTRRFPAIVKSAGGDSIYISTSGTPPNHIWRFIPSTYKLEDMGIVDPADSASETFCMGLRWDLNKLYYVTNNKLYSIDVLTKQRVTEIQSVGYSYDLAGNDGIDKNGDFWCTKKGTDNMIYKFTLGVPCAPCSQRLPRFSIAVENAAALAATATGLSVFPNPARGAVQLTWGQHDTPQQMAIYDVKGREIKRWNANDLLDRRQVTLTRPGLLANGVYLVEMMTGNRRMTAKMVVAK